MWKKGSNITQTHRRKPPTGANLFSSALLLEAILLQKQQHAQPNTQLSKQKTQKTTEEEIVLMLTQQGKYWINRRIDV